MEIYSISIHFFPVLTFWLSSWEHKTFGFLFLGEVKRKHGKEMGSATGMSCVWKLGNIFIFHCPQIW